MNAVDLKSLHILVVEDIIRQAKALGVRQFFEKPFEMEALKNSLK